MTHLTRRCLLKGAAIAAAGAAAPLAAWAEGTYPDHPLKLVVPFPAGALTDTLGRMVANNLSPVLGQPIVVENRPGAGTLLGAAQVAKSAPDGYTLMVATSTTLAISPAMYAKPAAVPSDFTGVAMIGNVSLLLVTRPDLPAHTLPELVALIRRSPGKYNFASPSTGTMHHLVVEMVKAKENLKATHVPYQGSMAALTDLLSGRVDFMFLDAVAAMPHVKAGKLRVIAVAAPKRLAALPDVPLVAETYPDIDVYAWQTIAAPRATPAAIVDRLNADLNKLLGTAQMHAELQKVGVAADPLSVQALNQLIDRDAKRFAELVRAVGVHA
jgi:tripartite-type tricarboxylate transporter receptor subunit TctC